MKNRLNGWQRLWVVISALYVCAILIVGVRFGLPPDTTLFSHLLSLAGFLGVPVIGLYLIGLALAWIIGGFRDGGVKSTVAWRRLWIVGSIALLIGTVPNLVSSVHTAIVADRILAKGSEPGEWVNYEVASDENGQREVFISIYPFEWVNLGPVVNPEAQSILDHSGKFNSNLRHWILPRDPALLLLKKYDSSDFMFRIVKALMIWLLPPLGIYLLAYFLFFGSKWIYDGFKTREHGASV